MTRQQQPSQHKRLVRRLVLVAVGMFGFGFALWPLYGVFCSLTGLGGRGVQVAETVGPMEKSDRQIKIRFDTTVNSRLPWQFGPDRKSAIVTLGELNEASFHAANLSESAIVGQAIYNVTPPEASLYFVKTECFCFTEQVLEAKQRREMVVYYYVQPDLPEQIKEITLSYTFFRHNKPSAALTSVAQPAPE